MLLTRSFNDYFHRSLKYHPLRTIFFAFVSNKIFVDLWSFIFDVHDNLTINIAIQYIIAKVSSRNANIQRSAMRPIQMSTEKGGFFECLAVTRFELHKWEPALSWPQSRLDQDRANERTNQTCGVNIQTRSESYDRTTRMHLRCSLQNAHLLDFFFPFYSRAHAYPQT